MVEAIISHLGKWTVDVVVLVMVALAYIFTKENEIED
jgi:hypothetical protein